MDNVHLLFCVWSSYACIIIILADYDVSNFAYDVFLILYAPEYPRKLGMLKQQVRCVET